MAVNKLNQTCEVFAGREGGWRRGEGGVGRPAATRIKQHPWAMMSIVTPTRKGVFLPPAHRVLRSSLVAFNVFQGKCLIGWLIHRSKNLFVAFPDFFLEVARRGVENSTNITRNDEQQCRRDRRALTALPWSTSLRVHTGHPCSLALGFCPSADDAIDACHDRGIPFFGENVF